MAPRDANPFEPKFPETEESLLEEYGIPQPGDEWLDSLAPFKKPSNARKWRKIAADRDMDFTSRLFTKVLTYKSDMIPFWLKPLVSIGKIFLAIFLFMPVFILEDILMLSGAFIKYVIRDPLDFLKFIGSLIIVGIVKIFEILFAAHAIYAIVVVVLLLLAGGYYAIYNPYLSPSPVVDLHLKTPDGNVAHITNNRSAADVTYAQVLQFLEQDDTSNTLGKYQTARVLAAVRLHDNAEKKGIRAGVVEVGLDNIYAPSYCWDVFNTTDQGMIYVTAYHPVLNETSDSLVYIPKSGDHEGNIFFIPADKVKTIRYDSLSEEMGQTAVGGSVESINIVW